MIITDLQSANKRIQEIESKIQENLPLAVAAEKKYTSRYHDLLLHAMAGDAGRRDAEAKKTLELEPVYEEYHATKLTMRLLWSEKEMIIEVCKNLRMLKGGD